MSPVARFGGDEIILESFVHLRAKVDLLSRFEHTPFGDVQGEPAEFVVQGPCLQKCAPVSAAKQPVLRDFVFS